MIDDNSHIRVFIAFPLPKETKNFLQGLQGQLKKSGIRASWTKPATMHLTLKFLGNVNINKIDTIKKCMIRAVTGVSNHTLSASGIGVFPSVKKARVIWSGTRGRTDILERLAKRLEAILFKDAGIKKENKRFSPHLTLARIKQPISPKTMIKLLQEFKDFCSEDFLVSEILLFQSELISSGAIHTPIFTAPFRL
ncbi:MAG: RNA 2',3'-cyclic phosphodiesterase [Desulfobacula sp.]|nr:RNA 2',3'-cyclic phosphodiesterase [Desulfobacula sp.]